MANFPKLLSGTCFQYPVRTEELCPVEVIEMVGGEQQRFAAQPRRRVMRLKLSQLSEGELAQLRDFVLETRIDEMPFSIDDPVTGATLTGCRLAAADVVLDANEGGAVELSIEGGAA